MTPDAEATDRAVLAWTTARKSSSGKDPTAPSNDA